MMIYAKATVFAAKEVPDDLTKEQIEELESNLRTAITIDLGSMQEGGSSDYDYQISVDGTTLEEMREIDSYLLDELTKPDEEIMRKWNEVQDAFRKGDCMFDEEKRVLYIPDFGDDGHLNGFMKAEILTDNLTLQNLLAEKADMKSLHELILHDPSGYFTHDAWKVSFDSLEYDDDNDLPMAIEGYVDYLKANDVLVDMVTEEAFIKKLEISKSITDEFFVDRNGISAEQEPKIIKENGLVQNGNFLVGWTNMSQPVMSFDEDKEIPMLTAQYVGDERELFEKLHVSLLDRSGYLAYQDGRFTFGNEAERDSWVADCNTFLEEQARSQGFSLARGELADLSVKKEEEKMDAKEMFIEELEEKLPHGSGINDRWDIEYENGNYVCKNSYDHINDDGMYDAVIPFTLTIPENDMMEFQIDFKKEDQAFVEEDMLDDYLDDIFADALRKISKSLDQRVLDEGGVSGACRSMHEREA